MAAHPLENQSSGLASEAPEAPLHLDVFGPQLASEPEVWGWGRTLSQLGAFCLGKAGIDAPGHGCVCCVCGAEDPAAVQVLWGGSGVLARAD